MNARAAFVTASRPLPRLARRVPVFAATALLSACASFSPDGGLDSVKGILGNPASKDIVALRTPDDAEAARRIVASLLTKPLTADTAVQIALLNNRGLQAAYQRAGASRKRRWCRRQPAAQSDLLASRASRAAARSRSSARSRSTSSRWRRCRRAPRSPRDRFRQAQLRRLEETLRLAAETRRAYYRAVAARELAAFLAQAKSAAQAAAQLARRLGETGAAQQARSGARAGLLRRD